MYQGWFSMGGNEVVNNERARALSRGSAVPAGWLVDAQQPTVQLALSPGVDYSPANITTAPWYDPTDDENSRNFFGVFGLSVTNLPDSTRQVAVIESVYDGGTLGIPRKAVRQVKVDAIILARGREALEYGFLWLDSALDANACGQHGNLCGLTDFAYLVDIPPAQDSGQTDDEYAAEIATKMRYLHDVGTISGPFVTSEWESRGINAYMVEFTIAATRPFIFTQTTDLNLPPSLPVVVEDIPYNLAPYPSLELTDGSVVVANNYVTNPSLETNATSWTVALGSIVSGNDPTPYLTSGTSTDISADRASSLRGRVFGNGSTAAAGECTITATTTADLTTPLATANTRVSFTAWLGLYVLAGAGGSALHSMTLSVQWLNSSNANVGSPVVIGSTTASADFNGKVFSQKSLVPPAGAAKAKIIAAYDFSWTSSSTPANNSDVRCYIDAVAVTVP